MNHSTVKVFSSVSSTASAMSGKNSAASSPVDIPRSTRPIAEDGQDKSAVLVNVNSSITSLTTYQHIDKKVAPDPNSSLPDLFSCSSDSEVHSKVKDLPAKRRTRSGASIRLPPNGAAMAVSIDRVSLTSALGQALGRTNENLCTYKSNEVVANLSKDRLLKTSKRGHSWHCVIPVEINRKKDVQVHIFLLPKLSSNGTKKAVLYATAEVRPRLLTRLAECGEEFWVVLETEVADPRAGKRYGYTNFPPHAFDREDGGQISFSQDLVSCDEVAGCRGYYVQVSIRVTFVTCQRDDYILEDGEDGFCVVSHKN